MSDPDTDHIDVRYVANLARIDLTDAEIERLTGELDQILSFVHQLDMLDLAGVEPLSHPHPISNVFREDVPGDCLDREDVLENAPATVQQLIRVPQMMGES
ncbi:MAG: Asp-tRNA(Asn)/Glu-tRNA(Gln) amidotransferase subunit GatC [Verrucomicrobia bacterium]|nr:Asp-tRNA(Asn)/Glu-tRNA(Gln) amidotransferase subunit GatC [Verrucomicrobiota bacterium]MCH8510309.1 Asp-tRNA(Asn)/Glu-tRNA(Gln) amidotransferase subunit GatC [Kiritimatiellia bacterium]